MTNINKYKSQILNSFIININALNSLFNFNDLLQILSQLNSVFIYINYIYCLRLIIDY